MPRNGRRSLALSVLVVLAASAGVAALPSSAGVADARLAHDSGVGARTVDGSGVGAGSVDGLGVGVATVDDSGVGVASVDGEVTFDLQEGRLFLPPVEDATVTGTATWSPGTELTVVLRSPHEPRPFILRNETVVDEYGNWEATFDLSDLPEGQTFTATVRRQGQVEASAEGEIGRPEAAVTFEDGTVRRAGTAVLVRSVRLELGGFVALHEGSPRGEIVGVSEYLPPGPHENVTIGVADPPRGTATLVAMPHLDTDDDRRFDFVASGDDGPYLADEGTPVTDAATVQFPPPTPTPRPPPWRRSTTAATPSVDGATTVPGTAVRTSVGSDRGTTEPTGTTAPGFGPPVALAALAVAVRSARRRD